MKRTLDVRRALRGAGALIVYVMAANCASGADSQSARMGGGTSCDHSEVADGGGDDGDGGGGSGMECGVCGRECSDGLTCVNGHCVVQCDDTEESSCGFCGDGVVEDGEQCDDGNSNNFDGCRNDCTLPRCGDGILDPGEQCDDGNNVDGDGCPADCGVGNCGLTVTKTCSVTPPPSTNYVCTKPIDSLTMTWLGTNAILVDAYKGAVGSSTQLTNHLPVAPGQTITITGFAGSPNDVYWQLFDAATGASIGQSTFHLSCSDRDMNGPEDCGKTEGDGKGKIGYINMWKFGGMSGAGQTLVCSTGTSGFPSDTSCQVSQTTGTPSCASLGVHPTSLTFKYTGAACNPAGNQQGSKASCTDSGTLPNNATFSLLTNASKFTVTPGFSLTNGDSFTISTIGGANFPASIQVAITGGGATQTQTIHTSCSAPLAVGDAFGAFTLVGFNGLTGGASVTYGYHVTNSGGAMTDVTVVDSKLGVVAGPFALGAGESRDFTATGAVSSTTTNDVLVHGTLASGASCEATDSLTVTVGP